MGEISNLETVNRIGGVGDGPDAAVGVDERVLASDDVTVSRLRVRFLRMI